MDNYYIEEVVQRRGRLSYLAYIVKNGDGETVRLFKDRGKALDFVTDLQEEEEV